MELTISLPSWNVGVVKPALKGNLVALGEWRSKAPAGHADHNRSGALSEADILIEKGRSGLSVVKVQLPAGAADPTVHPVEVKLQLAYGKYWAGESNVHQMLIKYDGGDDKFNQVVSHEFGHGFGQTPRLTKQPKPLADHAQQYDDAYGGQGSHCGSDSSEVADSATTSGKRKKDGTCIMFHQVNPTGCKQLFCDTCDPYLRLQDFSALRKST